MIERNYVALDIGETNIKAVAMNEYASKFTVIASTIVKTNGITNGDITNANDLAISIKEALSNLESQDENVRTDKVLLVLPSSKMKVYRKKTAIDITARDHIITSKDIKDLKVSFSRSDLPVDELIVNIIPLFYKIDGGNPIYKEPSGMSANTVEFEANILTLPSFIARSYVDIVQNLGCEILDAVLSPLALGELLIDQNSNNNGKVIVDIGGKNTVLSFFQNGILIGTSLVRFGSNLLTSEISKQFDLSFEKAERLKIEYGNASTQLSEQISIYEDEARGLVITERDLADVICKKLDEYYIELNKQASILTRNIMYPLLIVGGGSHLSLLDDQVKIRLGRETLTYISNYIGARNNAFLPCIGTISYYVNKNK